MTIYATGIWAPARRVFVRQGRKPALAFTSIRAASEHIRTLGRLPSVKLIRR